MLPKSEPEESLLMLLMLSMKQITVIMATQIVLDMQTTLRWETEAIAKVALVYFSFFKYQQF